MRRTRTHLESGYALGRIVLAAAILAHSALAGVTVAALAKEKAPVSWAVSVLPDPGPMPTLESRDYDAYAKEGTSVIMGHVALPASFGRDLTCLGEDVLLYPSTPYTRWIIQTWAREVDGGTQEIGFDEPDDFRTGIVVPAYLRAMRSYPPTAVRFGHCNESDNIYIGHIPAGRYILITWLDRQVSGGDIQHEYGQAIVNTPYGEHPENYVTRTTGGWHYDDGYIVTFDSELEVKAGEQYTIASDSMRAVAHYEPRKGGT